MSLPYKAEVKHDQDGYGRASNQRPYWMVEPKILQPRSNTAMAADMGLR